ncbi:heterokaryon incompatibility protein-domain-containing protein [Xylaria arbuscula]|nr:heterokaryon incompatibility protein-domain-containing protein [Xylaria arbuscula]
MPYQYEPLLDSRIRLLALLPGQLDEPLRGELFEAEFCSVVKNSSYEALSYVWGDKADSRPLFIIGSNLHSALRHLRLDNSKRIIWCDIICINQLDTKERAREILRMADIYRTALAVLIWLGPESDDSALAMEAIEYAGAQIHIEPKLRMWWPIQDADPRFAPGGQEVPFSDREMQAIKRLIARSWFKRLWVRQEVTLASSAVVICGTQRVSWKHFIAAAAFLDTFIRLGGTTDAPFGRDLYNLFEFACLKSYENIMDIFHACRACECTEDHDRVYALLGLLSSQQMIPIQPDYGLGVKRVYQDLVMKYYQHTQRLNILTLCESAETPSWVPDLQKLRLNTGINTRAAHFCWASGEAPAQLTLHDDNTLVTYGVKCGVLGKNASPSIDRNSEAAVRKAAIVQILKDHVGEGTSRWNHDRLEVVAKGLLGCIWNERTGRENHSRLAFALSELKEWAKEGTRDHIEHPPAEPEGHILLNHITRVLFHGDSSRWTHDGHLGLGYNACKEGDILYAILGCRRLMALRKQSGGKHHRIVGKFDHPGYDDGEAFVHENGSSQWQDPRLQGLGLPSEWCEGEDERGCPYWFQGDGIRTDSDPRLTLVELEKRGIKAERLSIV